VEFIVRSRLIAVLHLKTSFCDGKKRKQKIEKKQKERKKESIEREKKHLPVTHAQTTTKIV